MLATYGYTEADVRAHSLDWVSATLTTLNEREAERLRLTMAGAIQTGYVAQSASQSGEEGHDAMLRIIHDLLHPEDGDEAYETDPHAAPDPRMAEKLADMGIRVQRIHHGDALPT